MISFSYMSSWYSETKKSFWHGEVSTGCKIREYELSGSRIRIIQKFHPDNTITYVFLDKFKKKPIKEFTETEVSAIAELLAWIDENKERLYPHLIMNKSPEAKQND